MGDLPIGDVMLSQKIALESAESYALRAARRFAPDGTFRRRRLLRSVDRLVLARDRGPIGRVELPTVTPDDWKQRISSHVAFQRDNEAMVAARDIVDRCNFHRFRLGQWMVAQDGRGPPAARDVPLIRDEPR